MATSAPSAPKVVLYEGIGSQPLASDERRALLTLLLDRGYTVSRVVAGEQGTEPDPERLVVLGKFESDPSAGVPGVAAAKRDITGLSAEAVLQIVDQSAEASEQDSAYWKPWFPVIDYDRCTNCMQCLSFCLFDVYGVTPEGQITVRNETNCKTDCPACSRVCPEVAILFPKYKAGPINGDEISDDDLRREAMKVDISSLLGGDIYSMLRDRNAKAKSRFSKERDDDRALKERQRCLKKIGQQMEEFDIPAEALANLPSPDEIRFKAEQAKKLAEAALAQNQANQSPSE